MEDKLKKIVEYFLEEWLTVFIFAGFFALVFGNVSLMGWFVLGTLTRKYLFD